MRRSILLCALLFATLLAPALPARADNIFDLARKPKQRVAMALSPQPSSREDKAQTPMMRRVDGLLAELTAQQAQELCATVDPHPPSREPDAPADPGVRVCFVSVTGPAGERLIEIVQTAAGEYSAAEVGTDRKDADKPSTLPPRRSRLKPDLFDRLLATVAQECSGYCGDFKPSAQETAKVFEVPRPYHFSPIQLDAATIRGRIGSSPLIRYDPTRRVLQQEKFFARLPKQHDPRRPAGLLVYMDPMPLGRPPEPLWKALDEFGFVCIAPAAAGNDRFATERLQLGLDAVSTARRRWNIDPSRIYISGVSGGGKMSSESLVCFPDVYSGAVSIVGLSWWENLPTGEGNKMWPAEFSKPSGKRWNLLLMHRLAAVTGSEDFNHPPVTAGVKFYERNRINVRLFDIEGMGHEFPSAEAFTEQLGWVDQPARESSETTAHDADAAFRAAEAVQDAAARTAAMIDVTRRWPWTPAGWRAQDRLIAERK